MISLCITTWNRDDLTIQSFIKVLHDKRISEIVIVDDCSDTDIYLSLDKKIYELKMKYPEAYVKINLYRNGRNLGCYRNKREAVSKAINDWVILFDSDNALDSSYIDAILEVEEIIYPNVILAPEFARPTFDFTKFSGLELNKNNISEYIDKGNISTMLNAMNYFVNKNKYLEVWEDRDEPWTADSLLQNYNWLKVGYSIIICPGMQYDHLIHSGSHYKNNVKKTGNLAEEILQKYRELK